MPAKKDQVVLGEATYNFSISRDRVWLEDDVSKLQWEWRQAPEAKSTSEEVPAEVLLCAAKEACENGGRTSDCIVTIEAAETPGDLALRVKADIGCSRFRFWMTRVFVLEAVPLTSEQIWDAKYADMWGQIQDLKQQVVDADAKTARLQAEIDKTWWQKLWEWVRRVVGASITCGDRALAAAKSAASEVRELLCKLVEIADEWMKANDEQPARRTAGAQKTI